jgi:hypothetical protein
MRGAMLVRMKKVAESEAEFKKVIDLIPDASALNTWATCWRTESDFSGRRPT